MVDWKRLGLAALSVALCGGVVALMLLVPKVLVVIGAVSLACIIVCIFIALFYKALGD